MRRLRLVLLAATLATPTLVPALAHAQSDDDWSVTRRPGRRPSGPRRPAGPSGTPRRPGPVRPRSDTATTASDPQSITTSASNPARDRRSRMIAVLTESVLRGASDDAAPLAVLLRLVRERDGSIDAVVADFEARARAATSDPGPHLALGHLYREAGRFEDALREYATAERAAPQNPAPARAAGALYRRMDRNAEARAAYDRALARTSDRARQADTLRELAAVALATHDVAAARSYHARLIALDPRSNTVRRELAELLLSQRLFADAIAEYQSVARAMAGDNRVLPPVLRDLGRAYAGNNQYDEAIATYRRALALAGSDAGIRRELYDAMTEVYTARNQLPAWIAELERMPGGRDGYERAVLLGRLHREAGNATAAIGAYRRALAARPGDVDVRKTVAEIYRTQGQRTEAIAEYRRLTELSPHEPQFLIDLVDLMINEGRADEAFRLVAQASARAGSDPQVHERLADLYARHGRQQDALREIELVARYDPSSPVGLIALGRQYMELGQRERALATWRRILETARDRARGAVSLAEVYADNAMLTEAIEMYREAIRLRPNELEYHRGLAGVLERARQFAPAVGAWRRVIELARQDRDVRRHAREAIVRLWGLEGQLPAQIAALEAAFARNPPDLEAGRDLAEALVRARRAEDAERVLRRITTLDRADVVSLATLERVLTQRGDLAGALEVLRRLVEADPRRAREFYQRMAQHALALHRDDEAVEYATRAVQLNDQDATAHLRLAELYRARGDLPHAIAALKRALELNDRLFPTYFELADLYLGYRAAPAEAIALYRRVVQLAPDDDYVQRAGRQAIQIAPAAGLGEQVERDLASAAASAPGRPVFRRLLVAFYDATARPLINRVQQGAPDDAARARTELSHLGARAIAPLLDALGDPDPAQQRVALDILGYLGNPNATGALVAVAEGSADAEIKRRALAAAGALGDARALPRLVALMNGPHDLTLATIATWGVAHVRSAASVAALARALREHPAVEVRAMAALGLAGNRDARARSALRSALSADGPSVVRAAAAYALGTGLEHAVVPVLLAALEAGGEAGVREESRLRAAAAVALGEGGTDAASTVAPALCAALFAHGDANAGLRRAAARALAHLAGGRSAATASSRVFDDPALAPASSRMLDALLDPPGAPIDGAPVVLRFHREILDAARNALSVAPERVAAVLSAFAEPGALAPLATAAAVARVEGAREALARIVDELAPALGALLSHRDASIRRGALRVLASSEAPAALEPLARAAGDHDETLAAAALTALARRGDAPGAFDAIAARLSPETPWTLRAAAASALARVSDPRATERLAAALRDDDYEYVRSAAARALGEHRTLPAAREALVRAARSDPDASVRTAARTALE